MGSMGTTLAVLVEEEELVLARSVEVSYSTS
jgi:hypothetical protein